MYLNSLTEDNQKYVAEIRWKREYERFNNCEQYSISLEREDNICEWRLCIKGNKETIYENWVFFLHIDLKNKYPFSPPRLKFMNEIIHPFINSEGEFYIQILEENWHPALTVEKIVPHILNFIDRFDDKLDNYPYENKKYSEMIKNNKDDFIKLVKESVLN